jgi:hypothetical protein
MTASPKDAAAAAQDRRAAVASVPDRIVRTVNGHGPQQDSRIAQLQRCITRADRVLQEANSVPAYFGSDPKRIAVCDDANRRAHTAWLRRNQAMTIIAALAS